MWSLQCYPDCSTTGAKTRLPDTLTINYTRANAPGKISMSLSKHYPGRLLYSPPVKQQGNQPCAMHFSLQIRGQDQVPVLTRWWRELLPAVEVVEVPVKEVAEFLQQQHVEPEDQNPWDSVLCRVFPPLPGLKSSNPGLTPELLLPFSRNTKAQPIPAPQSPPDVLSPGPCMAEHGAFPWQPAKASPAHKHKGNVSRGCSGAKGCWTVVAGEGHSCCTLS